MALHETNGHAKELQYAEWNSEQPHGAEPIQRGCVCICKLSEQYVLLRMLTFWTPTELFSRKARHRS